MKLLTALIFSFLGTTLAQFEVPDALVEVFKPRGLRVSIPDEEGIKLFAFHAKINEEMNGREGGYFSRDILKAKNGRWTFYDPTAQLKIGDTLYYWTYVDYFDGKNKLGYVKDDQEFVVTELLEKQALSDCTESVTIFKNKKTCKNKLILDEDFNSIDPSIWKPEIKFAGEPDYEFVFYANRSENLAVKNSKLEIRPLPSEEVYGPRFVTSKIDLGNQCTGKTGTSECEQTPVGFLIAPPVASAQLTTKDRFSFKYGRIEIKAKLPKGDWVYPELYLNPQKEEYGSGYASGQIRVAFIPGNWESLRNLEGGCILGSNTEGRKHAMKNIRRNEGSWCDDFHTFAVIWKPDQITFSVDNHVYGNINPPPGGFANLNWGNHNWRSGSKLAPFDKEMYLTVGVGVGGYNFEDRHDGTKPWRNKEAKAQKKFYRAQSDWRPTWDDSSALQVDYIKVWTL